MGSIWPREHGTVWELRKLINVLVNGAIRSVEHGTVWELSKLINVLVNGVNMASGTHQKYGKLKRLTYTRIESTAFAWTEKKQTTHPYSNVQVPGGANMNTSRHHCRFIRN